MIARIRKLLLPIIIISFIALALTSCNTSSPPGKGTTQTPAVPTEISDPVTRRAIFYYANFDTEEKLADDTILHDTISANFIDENRKESFVQSYLQEHGISANTPDGVTYAQGKPYAEYYTDKDSSEMCFIFHAYLETVARAALESITCTTVHLADLHQIGELACGSDPQQGVDYESLYNTAGNQTAYIAYKDMPGVPFPFITKYQGGSNDVIPITDMLYRRQKFWIYYDKAEFDQAGKWAGSDGDIFGGGFSPGPTGKYFFHCSYDAEGHLQEIDGTIQPDEGDPHPPGDNPSDFPTAIKLIYQENGELSVVHYNRDEYIYGTNASSGEIYYDTAGRMVYETAYLTSGAQYNYYVYKGDERQPWICIRFGGMWYGGEKKYGVDCEYGIPLTVYMFQP